MTWRATLTPKGAFAVFDESTGATLMTGATDPGFGPALLNVITEVPAMVEALQLSSQALSSIAETLIASHGEEKARAEAGELFQLRDLVEAVATRVTRPSNIN